MAEEQEPKKPRKTTLIKHKKPEEGKAATEKKKVVVVKKKPLKKVVKVKRAPGRPAEEPPETERKADAKPGRPQGFLGRSPREPSPFIIVTISLNPLFFIFSSPQIASSGTYSTE